MKPYKLSLNQKTGFKNNLPNVPVMILDTRGIPFYDTSLLDDFVNEFNMPPGEYIVQNGNISQMNEPVDYSHLMLPLPPPCRRKINPENFDIIVADNPYKCSVDWKNKQLIFDHSLVNESLPKLRRIYEHEMAHRYYGTKKNNIELIKYYEACCDRYSHNKMLEDGYNPSQIGFSMIDSLSSYNKWREDLLIDDMVIANTL